MNSATIRRTFLDFFAARGHKIVPSSPLLPKDDPTLLFTNAGMNQFKNIFLGLEKRSYSRAATVQKCMRVSGKHNDLEQVGRTSKHHTFFEMLGNFSFGDYFKADAIVYAWELMTEVFKLPPAKMYVTVYEDDDEAFRLWTGRAGVPAERIFRLGKKDNFWAMGETGPCGPCSEIHYDVDPAIEPGDPKHLIESGSERFVELWNLVFMQYEQDASGTLRPLPKPSIDTGMGLERMAAVLQGRASNWETDLFLPLIREIADLSGRDYPAGDDTEVSFRLIADHSRSAAFLIGDGIMPANDGRGYVLRRLIRRAFRHGNLLGLEEPFVFKLVGAVSDLMADAYPELKTALPLITKVCRAEEERFAQTLSSGIRYFNQYVRETRARGGTTLAGEAVFKLYDTFGFPLDLSRELAEEERLAVDEDGFNSELDKQKDRARSSWKGGEAQAKERKVFEDIKDVAVKFVGYDRLRVEGARIVALFRAGSRASSIGKGESGEAVLDTTPFYAEAGGQVGDTGRLSGPAGEASVEGTYSPIPGVASHRLTVSKGSLREGDVIVAAVDEERRKAIRDNHTATHLLHAALRKVLGSHVKQAGSLVTPARLRFDFTHFQSLSPEEIRKIEGLVNEKIRANLSVLIKETTLEQGIQDGAMAIFEEKYGETVRLVAVGDFSRELCGGAHAPDSGEIGLFKIVSEAGIAAGMRRIEALTGAEALIHVQETEEILQDAARSLNTSRKDLPDQIEKIKDLVRDKEHEIRALRMKLVQGASDPPSEEVRTIRGTSVIVRKIEGLQPTDARDLADRMKQKLGSGIVVLGSAAGEKAFLVVGVTKDLTPRVSAAEIIKVLAPFIGGGGGGRPDFAQAGGPKTGGLDKALEHSLSVLEMHLTNHP
jgi:alanyl-tRNA synthetase